MTTMRVVGECFFWYRLTRVFPDKFHRAVKRLCVCVFYPHTHNRFTALWIMSGTTQVSRYQKGKTRKVKTNLDLLEQEIVSGCGICWQCWAICKVCTSSQTTTPTSHHSVFLQAGYPSCRPTNSVKALKALVVLHPDFNCSVFKKQTYS